jgi:hypothetical protein
VPGDTVEFPPNPNGDRQEKKQNSETIIYWGSKAQQTNKQSPSNGAISYLMKKKLRKPQCSHQA